MATTSQTNGGKNKGVSKKGGAPTPLKKDAKECVGINAKELGGEKNVQLKADFYVIDNPDKPLSEYIIVFPEDFKKGLEYQDYVNKGLRIFSCEPLIHLSNPH